jgi:sulfite exporter TauE/SafE
MEAAFSRTWKEDSGMAKRSASLDTSIILQVVVGIFLITLGLVGIVHWDSNVAQFGRGLSRAFGRANDPVNLTLAVAEAVAGAIVLFGVFYGLRSRLLYAATLVIAVLWAIRVGLSFFALDIFEPDFLVWLNRLAADLIVLLSLWLVNRKYA